jgi:hypothetical protein
MLMVITLPMDFAAYCSDKRVVIEDEYGNFGVG